MGAGLWLCQAYRGVTRAGVQVTIPLAELVSASWECDAPGWSQHVSHIGGWSRGWSLRQWDSLRVSVTLGGWSLPVSVTFGV